MWALIIFTEKLTILYRSVTVNLEVRESLYILSIVCYNKMVRKPVELSTGLKLQHVVCEWTSAPLTGHRTQEINRRICYLLLLATLQTL